MGRVLAIGDIHGGLKALKQIWERAEVSIDDQIIFLGDYVDGWADSFDVVEHLMGLDKAYNCIFIMGNHDLWLREWLTQGMIPMIGPGTSWKDVGGQSTIRSYTERPPTDMETHMKFLNRLHHYYEDEQRRLFVHAGYTQGGGARFENPTRNLWWDRSLLEKAYAHENKFRKRPELKEDMMPGVLTAYNEIFIGHTSTQLYDTIHPMRVCNLINLDTGGGHRHGKLTIMDVDTKEYWQSDKLKDLYSDDPQNEYFKNEGENLI